VSANDSAKDKKINGGMENKLKKIRKSALSGRFSDLFHPERT
jgi:hypothetical protein